MPFAGHPVLGTAFVISKCFEEGKNDHIKLNLKVGQIPVKVSENGMTMSQNPPEFGEIVPKDEIADIYGIDADDIRDDFPVQWVSTGLEAVIIPLATREALSKLKTDKEKFLAYVKRHPANYCNHLFFVDMGNDTFSARCLMEGLRCFMSIPALRMKNGLSR